MVWSAAAIVVHVAKDVVWSAAGALVSGRLPPRRPFLPRSAALSLLEVPQTANHSDAEEPADFPDAEEPAEFPDAEDLLGDAPVKLPLDQLFLLRGGRSLRIAVNTHIAPVQRRARQRRTSQVTTSVPVVTVSASVLVCEFRCSVRVRFGIRSLVAVSDS